MWIKFQIPLTFSWFDYLSYISKIVCENFEVFLIWFYDDSLMFDNLNLKWCKFFLIDRILVLENYVMFRHHVCLFSRKLFEFVVWNIGWYIFLWKKWGFVTFSWFFESTSFCYTTVNFYQITIIIPSKFQVFSKFWICKKIQFYVIFGSNCIKFRQKTFFLKLVTSFAQISVKKKENQKSLKISEKSNKHWHLEGINIEIRDTEHKL